MDMEIMNEILFLLILFLFFEIELLNFSTVKDLSKNKDGGIIKKVLEEGEFGSGNPIYESAVILTYICKLEDGTIIERCSEKMFELGDDRLCEGLERVIESMKIKEKAWVKIAPAYAYGENGIDKIPPNSTLIYEVVLHEFQKAKEPWDYKNFNQIVEIVLQKKERGNTFYQEEKN